MKRDGESPGPSQRKFSPYLSASVAPFAFVAASVIVADAFLVAFVAGFAVVVVAVLFLLLQQSLLLMMFFCYC